MKYETLREITRYTAATIGMYFVALGIALSIFSNLGTSALSAPGYVANLKFSGISVGTFTWIFNLLYIFIQLGVLKKEFKAKYLTQIIASVMLGYMIDLNLWLFSFLTPGTFAARFFLILVSCLVTAFGTSIELASEAWMLSAEMTVGIISKAHGWRFSIVKIVMDCSLLVFTMAFSWFALGNPVGKGEFPGILDWLTVGTEGTVIGIGTIISAFGIGWSMKLTTPVVEKFIPSRDAAKSWLHGRHLQ